MEPLVLAASGVGVDRTARVRWACGAEETVSILVLEGASLRRAAALAAVGSRSQVWRVQAATHRRTEDKRTADAALAAVRAAASQLEARQARVAARTARAAERGVRPEGCERGGAAQVGSRAGRAATREVARREQLAAASAGVRRQRDVGAGADPPCAKGGRGEGDLLAQVVAERGSSGPAGAGVRRLRSAAEGARLLEEEGPRRQGGTDVQAAAGRGTRRSSRLAGLG